MIFHLHSNMVRFIMSWIEKVETDFKIIYIPIWLDLLSSKILILFRTS